MDVKIISVHNHGDQNEEYVELLVTDNCDIGMYMISDTTYKSSGNVSNKLRHIFWFPDKKVQKGDYVFLYTKTGSNSDSKNKVNTTTYKLYWNIGGAIWNDTGDCAVLFKLEDWTYEVA
jgi:hypothetical protein